MAYVADVIETQLRNLDEAEKAKQEAVQPVSAPQPAPRQSIPVGQQAGRRLAASSGREAARYCGRRARPG
jgi:hypothetical protein